MIAHEQKHVDKFQQILWLPKSRWIDALNTKLGGMPAGRNRMVLAGKIAVFFAPLIKSFLVKAEDFEKIRQSLHLDHLNDHPYTTERPATGPNANQWIIREKAGTYGTYLTLQHIKTAFNGWPIPGLATATTKAAAIQIVNAYKTTILAEADAILNKVLNKF